MLADLGSGTAVLRDGQWQVGCGIALVEDHQRKLGCGTAITLKYV